ncbi:class I SAM-dependent methyltransferase [Streptomyces sulphureus]|uniref:class I SAM-dependent methyltransferase n=1 Tax=Streptomyces sulphureus TaxID=47758 RepID=UPI000360D7DD|nr:class I SAM-dependent methyltransferase [Streptomyces sulphureus]
MHEHRAYDTGSAGPLPVPAEEEPDAVRRPVGGRETSRANRHWWDRNADEYQGEHGEFLGDARFVWGPEGIDEADARLLGPPGSLADLDVLEVGAGAAQCARWLVSEGARTVALDLSHRQLQHALRLSEASPPPLAARERGPALVEADAQALPFADDSFDLACSAYGALPFVADSARVMREVARVLRPGGRWVFSVTHPIRWAFPDEPGPEGLTAVGSYFDRTPYVEEDAKGRTLYAEHHRTLGDRVRETVAAGLRVVDVVEPEWPEENRVVWGGWSPLRGRVLPGTLILDCELPVS